MSIRRDKDAAAGMGIFRGIEGIAAALKAVFAPYDHIEDTSNPHNVTKEDVDLGNVTNDQQVKVSELFRNGGTIPEVNQSLSWEGNQEFLQHGPVPNLTIRRTDSNSQAYMDIYAENEGVDERGVRVGLTNSPEGEEFAAGPTGVPLQDDSSFIRAGDHGTVIGRPSIVVSGSGFLNASEIYEDGERVLSEQSLSENGGNVATLTASNNFTEPQEMERLVVGDPDGGDQGTGTINAQEIFFDGQRVLHTGDVAGFNPVLETDNEWTGTNTFLEELSVNDVLRIQYPGVSEEFTIGIDPLESNRLSLGSPALESRDRVRIGDDGRLHTRGIVFDTHNGTHLRFQRINSGNPWIVVHSESGDLSLRDLSITDVSRLTFSSSGGLVVGSSSGDAKGPGSLNAVGGLYDSGHRVVTQNQVMPSVSGETEFIESMTVGGSTLFQVISLGGIVTALDLEPGDVIEVSGTDHNDNIYTVDRIDSSTSYVLVNLAHSNGAGPLSLTDETSTATITRLAKWYNAPIGLGQEWVDVTSSRSSDTTFTNTTRRAIAVVPLVGSQNLSGPMRWRLYVGGLLFSSITSAMGGGSFRTELGAETTIPSGKTYRLDLNLGSGDVSVIRWWELR